MVMKIVIFYLFLSYSYCYFNGKQMVL